MAFAAGALAFSLIAVIAMRRLPGNMTGAEARDRLRALEKTTHHR